MPCALEVRYVLVDTTVFEWEKLNYQVGSFHLDISSKNPKQILPSLQPLTKQYPLCLNPGSMFRAAHTNNNFILKKFKHSLEVEQAEDVIYHSDLSDVTDIIKKLVDEIKSR